MASVYTCVTHKRKCAVCKESADTCMQELQGLEYQLKSSVLGIMEDLGEVYGAI